MVTDSTVRKRQLAVATGVNRTYVVIIARME